MKIIARVMRKKQQTEILSRDVVQEVLQLAKEISEGRVVLKRIDDSFEETASEIRGDE